MPQLNPTTEDREEASGVFTRSPELDRALRALTEEQLREALASGEIGELLGEDSDDSSKSEHPNPTVNLTMSSRDICR